jgi:hypothetical protein
MRYLKKIFFFFLSIVLLSILTHFSSLSSPGVSFSLNSFKASEFIDSIGIDVKIYPEKGERFWTDIIKPFLKELGVLHIRTLLNPTISLNSPGRIQADRILELSYLNPPIKTTGMWREYGTWDEKLRATQYMLPALEAIEGPNEPYGKNQNFAYEYSGDTARRSIYSTAQPDISNNAKNWMHSILFFTEDLFYYLKDTSNPYYINRKQSIDSSVSKLNILPFSAGINAYKKFVAFQSGIKWNLEDWIDFGNYHLYRGSNPEKNTNVDYLKRFLFPSKQIIITETGYTTASGRIPSVPNDETQAIYNLRSLLELYRLGVKRTYIFSLLRLNSRSSSFSLLSPESSISKYKPRSSFYAIRDTISILKDDNSNIDFAPGSLNFSLIGNLKDLHKLALTKSDGKTYLILWLALPYQSLNLHRELKFKINDLSYKRINLLQPIPYGSKILHSSISPFDYNKIIVSDHPVILELIPKSIT